MTGRLRLTASAAFATVAASTALGAAYTTLGWLPATAVAVALVAAVLEAARRLRVPGVLGPPLALGALLVFATVGFARAHAWAGFGPTGASLRDLGRVAADGFHDISAFASPAPPTPGLVLITAVGVALAALVVDLVAVGLRRPAAAGLPLLAIFCVGSSVAPHGAGWLPFALGGFGYQVLLVADGRARIARWGRALGFDRSARLGTTWSAEGAQASPVAVLARRIGVTALGIAVVLPALVPGLQGTLAPRKGSGSGGGSSSVTTFNPIVRIGDQLRTAKPLPLLRFTTDDPDPDYLRLTSLDRFDGSTWSSSSISGDTRTRVSRGLPHVATVAATTDAQTKIAVEDLAVHWLPVPYPPTAVKVKGDWRYDARSGTVFSARSSTRKLTYTVTSARLQPTPAQLTAAPAAKADDPMLALPPLPSSVIKETQRVVAGAHTPFARALALQRYFTSGRFTYDVNVDIGDGTDALTNFLFTTRRGFCEQFAAAMAVMARVAGIPARVAVGFTHGTRQGDSWLVTTHDAHAWPELWFSGVGWVRFEPTPGGASDGQAQPPAYATASAANGQQNGSQTGPAPTPTPTATLGTKRDQMLNRGEENPVYPVPAVATPKPRVHRTAAVVALAALVLVLLLLPALLRLVTRRRRWRHARTPAEEAHAAWAQLHDDARDLGLDWRVSNTPRTAAAALSAEVGDWPEDADVALRRLVRAEERASYAAQGPDAVPGLRADVATVRGVLARHVGPARRARAVVLPGSATARLRSVGSGAADLVDRSEVALSELRRRLVPAGRRGDE